MYGDWILDQRTFTPGEMSRIVRLPAKVHRNLETTYLPKRASGGFQQNVVDALGMLMLAQAWRSNVALEVVAPAIPEPVRAALFDLALQSMPWPFAGAPKDNEAFRRWLREREGIGAERHVQELLNIHEKPRRRFLGITLSGALVRSDDWPTGNVQHLRLLIDALEVADELRQASEALFVARVRTGRGA